MQKIDSKMAWETVTSSRLVISDIQGIWEKATVSCDNKMGKNKMLKRKEKNDKDVSKDDSLFKCKEIDNWRLLTSFIKGDKSFPS